MNSKCGLAIEYSEVDSELLSFCNIFLCMLTYHGLSGTDPLVDVRVSS
jgi:hypothetical protein